MDNSSTKTVDYLLRESLVNFALDYKKTEMLKNLSSPEWKRHLVLERTSLIKNKPDDLLPEMDFQFYCSVKHLDPSNIKSRTEFEILKTSISFSEVYDSPELTKNRLEEYANKYNTRSRVMEFIKTICSDPDILYKTKLITNSNYRTLSFLLNTQAVTVLSYDERILDMTPTEALLFAKEKAESICVMLIKPAPRISR